MVATQRVRAVDAARKRDLRAARFRCLAAAALAVAWLGCASAGNDAPDDVDACSQLAEHLVALELDAPGGPASALTAAQLREHRERRMEVARAEFLPRCGSELSHANVSCQLAATDLDMLRTCVEAPQ